MRIANIDLRMPHLPRRPQHRGAHHYELLTGLTFALSMSVTLLLAPPPLRLIVLSSLLVIAAFASAMLAYVRKDLRETAEFTLWDQAGFLAFIGFGAILISDSEIWVPYLDQLLTSGPKPK